MKKLIGIAVVACLAFSVLCSLPFNAEKQDLQTASALQSPDIISSKDVSSVELVETEIRFDLMSSFDLIFKISSASAIKTFTVKTSGFNINSKEENGDKIVINVKYGSAESAFLSVKITLEDGTVLNSHAFGYMSSEGIFISPYSVDNAFERYNTYLLKNGLQN